MQNLELVSIHLNLTPSDSIHYATEITQALENAESAADTLHEIHQSVAVTSYPSLNERERREDNNRMSLLL